MKFFIAITLFLMSSISFAGVENNVLTPSTGPNYTQSIGTMLLALGAVISVLLIAVWLSKKLGVGQFSKNSLLSIKSHLALSQKEKLVVVEYQGKQILLGVAPGCVNCIDVSNIEDFKPLNNNDTTNFASKLMAVIKDRSPSVAPNSEDK